MHPYPKACDIKTGYLLLSIANITLESESLQEMFMYFFMNLLDLKAVNILQGRQQNVFAFLFHKVYSERKKIGFDKLIFSF